MSYCIWSKHMSSIMCVLWFCLYLSHIPFESLFGLHLEKHTGKGILGNLVQPGHAETSPSQPAQLSTKMNLSEGLIR